MQPVVNGGREVKSYLWTVDRLDGCRVLVVEDDYFLADDIVSVLSDAGANIVGPVPTISTALAQLSADVDAAVLDINLRGELVWPMADALRAKDVPFVFATGYGPEVVPETYSDVTHCIKPLEMIKLINALSALLARR